MSKYTPSGVERDLKSSINGYQDRARAVKDAYLASRETILADEMISDKAKKERLETLDKETRSKLDDLRSGQDSYVKDLRSKVEKELRGIQPGDANSVLLRRDATDRARKITSEKEALDVLADAVSNGDDSMAHAVGHLARQKVWVDVSDAYRLAQPATADVAAALSHIEDATSGAAFNVANSITFAFPG